jgi:hypothetical protein
MRYTMRHTINTDVDSFWKLTFDHEFNRALYQRFDSIWQLIEQRTDDAGVLHRRVEYRSKVDLPAIARKLVGSGAATEIGQYDPVNKKYVAQTVPDGAGHKFVMNIEVSTEPLGDRCCERILTLEHVVKVFGIGPILEKLIDGPQRDMQAKAVDFINSWIRERAPV